MSGWGDTHEMSELESTMWRAGRHPENSTHGGVLQILSGTPDVEELRRWHEVGTRRVPRFRQRVVEPLLPVGPPAWVADPHFDVDYHLRRVSLPAPGTTAQLLEVLQGIGSTPLDPARPPWTATFVEGLEGGRSAYFLVVHHCLMDGFGSMQLFAELQGRPEPADLPVLPDAPAAGPLAVAAQQVSRRALGLPRGLGRAAGRLGTVLKTPPAQVAAYAASMARVMAPPSAEGSALLASSRRKRWRYGVLDVELTALKAAAKASSGTINDVYLAAVLGGLRRYHEAEGVDLGDVLVNMPVSVRREGDAHGGNKFATAFIACPAAVVDPVERVAQVRSAVRRVSSEPALDFFSAVLPFVNRAPAAVVAPLFIGMQNRVDLTLSNVPGSTDRRVIAGHDVEELYYFGPLPGSPLMVVLHSHRGHCYIGVNCDGDVFDPDRLMANLAEGLDEVLAVTTR